MESNNVALVLSIIAILAVAFVAGSGITGNAVLSADKGKTKNTPCARECTQVCTPNVAEPYPGTEYMSTSDCVLQCMNARCGQTANAGKCDAWSLDECCNVFAETDPDCAPIPTCSVNPGGIPSGQCAELDYGLDCCDGPLGQDWSACPTNGWICK